MSDDGPFRLEREMLGPLRTALPAALELGKTSVNSVLRFVETPSLGSVIPDILMGVWHSNSTALLKGITYVEAVVLAFIENAKGASLADLLSTVYLTQSSAQRLVDRLIKRAVLQLDDQGRFALSPEYAPSNTELIAVEVKLRRWREALAQAVSYSSFANRAYVVLDGAQFVVRPETLNHFRDCGVGLLLQYGDKLNVAIDADRHEPIGHQRFLALQQLSGSSVLSVTAAPFAIPQRQQAI